MRGLIPALVIADLERRLQEQVGDDARVADYFHMFAGTSTGGLVALSLTVPDLPSRPDRPRISAETLAELYTIDGPTIFRRSLWQKATTGGGWIRPKYSLGPLEAAVSHRLDTKANLADALRDLVVVAYDMTDREPYFFKRWRAREELETQLARQGSGAAGGNAARGVRNRPLVDAALATSAAPTYFPSYEVEGHALIDGGVFAANPVIAGIIEALKRRRDKPHHLSPGDLLVVSIGTGLLHETRFRQAQVRRWGRLGWVKPQGGEPPILATVLGGSSDGADHWAHTLLNEPPTAESKTEQIGQGPRYFRLQVPLDPAVEMDDKSTAALDALRAAAAKLITDRQSELAEIADRLLRAGPIPADPPPKPFPRG